MVKLFNYVISLMWCTSYNYIDIHTYILECSIYSMAHNLTEYIDYIQFDPLSALKVCN